MIGMEDEDPIHRAFNRGVEMIVLSRNAKGHAHEIGRVRQAVLRVDEGLALGIFVTHGRDGWHLGDQTDDLLLTTFQIENVLRIGIEGGKCGER